MSTTDITSAGSAASMDLCLHVIRNGYGAAIANSVSHRLVFPAHREGGEQQFIERPAPPTGGASVKVAMDWARRRRDRQGLWTADSHQPAHPLQTNQPHSDWIPDEPPLGAPRNRGRFTAMSSLFAWAATGFLAGCLARWIVKDDRSGCAYTVVIGILGALIGGALMQAIDRRPLDDFSVRTVLVAALGAVLLLLVLRALGGRASGARRR